MKSSLSFITYILIFLLVSLAAVVAKDQPQKPKVSIKQFSKNPGTDLNNKITFSRQLIREKNYEGAAALLEELYEKYPEENLVINLLKQCYERLQLFQKAEELIRRHLDKYPDNFTYRLAFAENLIRQGKIQPALDAYGKTISLIENNNKIRQQSVLQSMIINNLDDKALIYIRQWRQDTEDSLLFALQLGNILEKQKKYNEAALEFYSLLPDTSQTGNNAEKKILALLNFVDSSPEVEEVLLNQDDLFINRRALKILATYYLKTNQYEKAFDFTITQDSIDGYTGNKLIAYMRNCINRKLYLQVIHMAEYMLRHSRKIPTLTNGYFLYAEALGSLGRYDDAINMYDTIFAVLPRSRDKAEALYNIGQIYLNKLNNSERALIYFDSINTHYASGINYLKALLAIPYCYLRQGELSVAKSHLNDLLKHRMNDDIKEEIQFNLALILFFEKKIDSCRQAFNKLIVDYPRGFYVNDVLQLMMIIDEAQSSPQILYDYSNALLFEQRQLVDSTIAVLELITQSKSKILADVALYKLALIKLETVDSMAAISYFDRLIEQFPESYYLPYGVKRKADIFLENKNKAEQAIELYRYLLENYPNYPFISEVRKKMRKLQDKAGSA